MKGLTCIGFMFWDVIGSDLDSSLLSIMEDYSPPAVPWRTRSVQMVKIPLALLLGMTVTGE